MSAAERLRFVGADLVIAFSSLVELRAALPRARVAVAAGVALRAELALLAAVALLAGVTLLPRADFVAGTALAARVDVVALVGFAAGAALPARVDFVARVAPARDLVPVCAGVSFLVTADFFAAALDAVLAVAFRAALARSAISAPYICKNGRVTRPPRTPEWSRIRTPLARDNAPRVPDSHYPVTFRNHRPDI
ncbi:MAG: hypothetical protein ACRDT6_14885 [Micromonosporaceae bacterium]